MDTSLLLIIIILGFFSLGAFMYWLKRSAPAPEPSIDPQSLLLLQQGMGELRKELRETLQESGKQAIDTSRHISNAVTTTVRDVTERLVRLEETNKQILSFSGQLENLQRILTNPKQRGILGEYYLETLLKNCLSPDGFQMQYKFKDGEIVDAAVFIKDKVIPIDSKFSLENYNRIISEQNEAEREKLERALVNDLKMRVQETAKYVRPEEGTMDFAFMFIPHEAIYYDLLTNKIGATGDDPESIIQRAAGKYHVIIVSPTSFLAYLQTVLQGLRALKIEEQAKEIRTRVGDLGRHLAAYEQHFGNVGKHLTTTVNQYNLASKELGKIDKDVVKISGQSTGYQVNLIDKPHEGEGA
jgi:DNA recombination protein RmuC